MTKEQKGMPRTDLGHEGGVHKPDDVGKTGGELGKQGGSDHGQPGEKKEWERPKEFEKPKEPAS